MAALVSRSGFDAARAAVLDKLYRGRSILCVGLGDGSVLDVLLARGAARVAGVDMDEAVVAAAQQRLSAKVVLKAGLLREAASLSPPFDVVLVRRGETMVARDLWRDVARLVRPGGYLVAAALAGDAEEAPRGAMRFHQLRDHAAAYFPHVTMVAQAAFAGAAFIPFGDDEVEPVLDTALARPPSPELYVAVAGPEPLPLAYGLVELSDGALEVAAATPAVVEPERTAAPSPELLQLRAQVAELAALRAQVAELAPLRSQVAELAALRSQVAELAALRSQVAELAPLRAQVAELAPLQAKAAEQAAEIARLQPVAGEVERLRSEVAEREGHLAAARNQHAQLTRMLSERAVRLQQMEAERKRAAEDHAHEVDALLARLRGSDGDPLGELRAQVLAQEQSLEAARAAALLHADQMRAIEAVLAERDAYVAELEGERRTLDDLRQAALQASARADEAEVREREARRQVAELSGRVLRLQNGAPAVGAPLPVPAALAGANHAASGDQDPAAAEPAEPEADTEIVRLRAQVAELEARCRRLQEKADEAQREAWAHLRGRSEAEAAAAEVREDTVRKLKDARKIANVELMRAMEEATRKAVSLKEELVRSERDRKEAVAALAAARARLPVEVAGPSLVAEPVAAADSDGDHQPDPQPDPGPPLASR